MDQHAPTMASDSDPDLDVAMLTDAPPTDAPPTSAMTSDAYLAAARGPIDDASETRTSVPGDLPGSTGEQTGPRRGGPTLATPPPVSGGGFGELTTGELDIGRSKVSPVVWGVVGGSVVLFALGLAAFFKQSDPTPEVDAAANAPMQGQPIEPVATPTPAAPAPPPAAVKPTPPFEAAGRDDDTTPGNSPSLSQSARKGVSASSTGKPNAATTQRSSPTPRAPISKPKRAPRRSSTPSGESLPSPGLAAGAKKAVVPATPPKETAEPTPPKKPSMPVSGL